MKLLVESEAITSVEYHEKTKIFEISFPNGEVYEYLHVPETIFQGFLAASSKGKFFHAEIKNNYMYQKKSSEDE